MSSNTEDALRNQQLAAIAKALTAIFPAIAGASTTSATAGGASALPGAPAGYLPITLPNGTQGKVPYWNP
jgi:hypothetical protein